MVVLFFFAFLCLSPARPEPSVFTFRGKVPMSTFRKIQTSVNPQICPSLPKTRLRMPHGVISQLPSFSSLPTTLIHQNRSGLLHMHNTALGRAFFFSYVLQRFNVSQNDFQNQPGLLYNYLSVAADVTANPNIINASTLMYDASKYYPNWLTTMPFNSTLPLFAVRAVRIDDAYDPNNWLREPTMRTIMIFDMGVGQNYTEPSFKNAPWYGTANEDPGFLPDSLLNEAVGGKKHLFQLKISWTPTQSIKKVFFGPPYPGQQEEARQPVRFTQPWYDCGSTPRHLNSWLMSATAPVIDTLPRYCPDKRLRRPVYTAVVAMDTFLVKIPVNLCPLSLGNPAPNLLAGSDACHPSTVCEPLMKKGSQFLPVTFQCRCRAGMYTPMYQDSNFNGPRMAAKATEEEYRGNGFKCTPIGNLMTWPTEEGLRYIGNGERKVPFARRKRAAEEAAAYWEQAKVLQQVEEQLVQHEPKLQEEMNWLPPKSCLVSRYGPPQPPQPPQSPRAPRRPRSTARQPPPSTPTPEPLVPSRARVQRLLDLVAAVTPGNCAKRAAGDLVLPGSASFGAEKQFSGQAAGALRLAHFLSAFLQLGTDLAGYSQANWRLGQRLHEHHVLGEVVANVAGDTQLVSSGVLFARGVWPGRTAFGPTAFRSSGLKSASFEARDLAGFGGYFDKPWFLALHDHWATNSEGLERFRLKAFVHDSRGQQLPFVRFPMTFAAPAMRDGYWSRPYFDCGGPKPEWLLTFAAPFFGSNQQGIFFAGVVTASVQLNRLNINQCPGAFHEANFFKNTALCPSSTQCVPDWGDGFVIGNYQCHCAQGYEFPFIGERFFFLGSMLEKQYSLLKAKKDNIFDILKCRAGSGERLRSTEALWLVAILLATLGRYERAIFQLVN